MRPLGGIVGPSPTQTGLEGAQRCLKTPSEGWPGVLTPLHPPLLCKVGRGMSKIQCSFRANIRFDLIRS